MNTYRRLTNLAGSLKEIGFDNSSKFVFFSDCHRGDNSWADEFEKNRNTYIAALRYYQSLGFTYIEIGDGDELWENRSFNEIKHAHQDVFSVLKDFYDGNRLYMIWGNHDLVKRNRQFMEKNLYYRNIGRREVSAPLFKGLKCQEGLLFRYAGTPFRILVIHGHQGDLLNDTLWPLGRFLTRYLRRPLELIGFNDPTSPARNYIRKGIIEDNIIKWINANKKTAVIAGHTHRPMFAEPGNAAYFNDGSCVHPDGATCIEIQEGTIALAKWSINVKRDGTLYVGKEIIAGPRKLSSYIN